MLEQRRNRRFDLKFQVELLRNGSAKAILKHGETKNISSAGVLFASDHELRVGDSIEYIVQLAGSQRKAMQLHCIGKVLRVEKTDEPAMPFRVAATIQRHRFIRVPE